MRIAVENDDAPEFIAEIERLVQGLIRLHKPESLIVLKIDGWFGSKWRGFSGKVLGALGVWKDRLTIPPFVPNRVLSQRKYIAPTYHEIDGGRPIHIKTASIGALSRFVKDVAPRAALVWYSGNSKESGRGSLMAYLPDDDFDGTWYTGWANSGVWRVVELEGTTARDLSAMKAVATVESNHASLVC
jgi:hypothetical protein